MPQRPTRNSLASAPSLSAAMWPSLSPAVKAKEAQTAQGRIEVRQRSRRIAADLRKISEAIRAEKGRRR